MKGCTLSSMYLSKAVVVAGLVSLSAAAVISRKPVSRLDDDFVTPLPLIIWHGLGDNYMAEGLRSVGKLAEEINPGTYVYYIQLAESAAGDRSATFFGNMTDLTQIVCDELATDPILSTAPAVNALGFSQGGQFLRGYIERCNSPPVANLVTFGSQHNGIAEFQQCGTYDFLCKSAEALLRGSTWSSFVQNRVVPAQYFRDPEDLDSYLDNSNYLADINNERGQKNATYKENLKKLAKFVMYIFEDDTTVNPKESGWFSEYNMTSEHETKLQNRTLYKEDWLGLKWLDERGRLEFKTTPGAHMQLSEKVLTDAFKTYFAAPKSSEQSFVSEEL